VNAIDEFRHRCQGGSTQQAIIETVSATANSSGQMVIQFATVKNNAQVNAIEID
jgi:precorrin-6B methylase 2